MDDHTRRAIDLLARTRQRGVELKRLGVGATADELDEAAEVLADLAILEASITNADLLRAYQRADGDSRKLEADALLAEIVRRGLRV